MCLVALALDQSSRFPFVLASNRDEFTQRPAARLAWWEPSASSPAVLGGRDLQAGGTWLGLTAHGRLGLVTNVRSPQAQDPKAPSRGDIVTHWLKGDADMGSLWPRLALSGYNGFNMLALDFAQGECFWLNNAQVFPKRLGKGVYGLSNAELDTPWPKVEQLKQRTRQAIATSGHAGELADALFVALADPEQAADEALPQTGVPLAWERLLSSAFIRSESGDYGTRCATVIVTERINKRLVTHVMERSFNAQGGAALLRRVTLKNWPPRHTAAQADLARLGVHLPAQATQQPAQEAETFESSDVSEHEQLATSGMAVVRKPRARSLIKSTRVRAA